MKNLLALICLVLAVCAMSCNSPSEPSHQVRVTIHYERVGWINLNISMNAALLYGLPTSADALEMIQLSENEFTCTCEITTNAKYYIHILDGRKYVDGDDTNYSGLYVARDIYVNEQLATLIHQLGEWEWCGTITFEIDNYGMLHFY